MKNNLKLIFLFTFLTTMSFISCSDSASEDDKQVDEELSEVVMQDFSTTLNDIQLPTSLAQSSSPYASLVNAQMQSFKSLTAAFSSLFTVPANAVALKSGSKLLSKSNNVQTYTWSANGITINYKITDSSDRYLFSFDIVSESYSGNYMNGYQLKDGSVAEINYLNNGQEYLTLKWTNLDTVAKMEMNTIGGYKLLLESNLNDNSGNMKVYEEGTLTSSFTWKADGSGTYTDHVENETFTF